MRWYLDINGQQSGPYDEGAVVQMIQSGQVQAAWICPEGGQQWVALGAHPPFAAALAALQAGAPAAAPVQQAAPVATAPAQVAAPVAAVPAQAAATVPDPYAAPIPAADGMQPASLVQPAAPLAEGGESDNLGRLFRRIPLLFTSPRGYWESMGTVSGSVGSLLIPNVLLLTGAAAFFALLGHLFGMFKLISIAPGSIIGGLLVALVLQIGVSIGIWLLMAVLINAFAGTFGAQKNGDAARKLAFGVLLPVWLISVLQLIPLGALGALFSLIGFGYGCYLLFVGLPLLNGTPAGKAVGYTATVMALTIVIALVLGMLSACPVGCAAGCAMKEALNSKGGLSALRSKLRGELGSLSGSKGSLSSGSFSGRARAKLKNPRVSKYKTGGVHVRSTHMSYGRYLYRSPMKLDLKFRGNNGTKIKIGNEEATIEGGAAALTIDAKPFFDKAAAEQSLPSATSSKRGVHFKVKIPAELVGKDGKKKEDTLELDGANSLGQFFKTTIKIGKPALFAGEEAGSSSKRSVLFERSSGWYYLGPGGKLKDVDMVAHYKWNERTRRCGTYRMRRSRRRVTVKIELNDKDVTLYDRRSGAVIKRKRFKAKGRCPRSTKSKRPTFFASDSKIDSWLKKQLQ